MTDPTRLLSARSDAEPLERSLLESLQRAGPGDEVKGAIWQNVAAGAVAAGVLASGSALATGATGATNTAAGLAGAKASLGGVAGTLAALVPKALATKLVLAGAIAASSAAGYAVWKTQHAAPSVHAAVQERSAVRVAHAPVQTGPEAEVVVPAVVLEDHAPVLAIEEPAVQARPHRHRGKRAQAQSERLLLESQLLAEARSALRAGDLSQTDLLLRRLHSEFPHGGLMQEREVLQVETTFAHGDAVGAQKRAQSFLARHPESPHNLTLRRFLSPP